MFRCSIASEPFAHDISQHEMIGILDGTVTRYFGAAAAALPPPPATLVATKDTIELQRCGIFFEECGLARTKGKGTKAAVVSLGANAKCAEQAKLTEKPRGLRSLGT